MFRKRHDLNFGSTFFFVTDDEILEEISVSIAQQRAEKKDYLPKSYTPWFQKTDYS